MEQYEPVSLLDWLLPQTDGLGFLVNFGIISLVLIFAASGFSFFVAALRYGVGEAFYLVSKVIATGISDLVHTSPRRVLAMSRLAVQESIRRRVLVAFIVFVVLLLFAGWFLDTESDHPGRLYLSFVLTATNYLVLLLALFLSTFSLPNDIKNRTIYTVVTKPVRALEIVLGRILGFSAVGTLILVVMCGVSYAFVTRGLAHTHTINPAEVEGTSTTEGRGETSRNSHHRHEFTIDLEQGIGQTNVVRDHWHPIERVEEDGKVVYRVGPPQGMLQARVPVYGKLRFLDRNGELTNKGLNVGYEWAYRSYIEGGSNMAAIWRFRNISEQLSEQDGLTLELNLRVFRTHKGEIERTVRGSYQLINPENPDIKSAPVFFNSQEFTTQEITIPRSLEGFNADGEPQQLDLFNDLVHNGELDIQIQCRDRGQFFGMAQPDVYVRAADQPFFMNFIKGYASIWLQMIVVTGFGVMFSTFLSGAVALLASLSSIVLGFFAQFIVDVATGTVMGGGPLESFVRIVTQRNQMVELEESLTTQTIQVLDRGLLAVMNSLSQLVPNYRDFSTASFVAYGYNIDAAIMAQQVIVTVAYLGLVSIVGYFFLKTREIAA